MVTLASELASHRIVLTGATGGLGRAILAEVQRHGGGPVLALVRAESRLPRGNLNGRFVAVDFSAPRQLQQALQDFRPTAVIHCAATGMQSATPHWGELVQCNVNLSVQLCETAAQIPDCRFVFVSSGMAYRDQGRPLQEADSLETNHPYGASKAAAEGLLRAAAAALAVPLTIVRPFSFSGPGDTGTRLFPSLLRAAAQGQALDLSSGEQIRDYCAVNDVARGILLALGRHPVGKKDATTFNLGSGRGETSRHLVESVCAALGLQVTLNFGARPSHPFEPRFLVADAARARHELGWKPEINFAHAIYELARESFPELKLREPRRTI